MPQITNRRYSPSFKIQVCTEIRSGLIGRREAQRIYGLGGGLIHNWLCKFDQGTLSPGLDPQRNVTGIMEDQIAELERLVGRLTAENQRLRHQMHALTSSNDNEANPHQAPRSAAKRRSPPSGANTPERASICNFANLPKKLLSPAETLALPCAAAMHDLPHIKCAGEAGG